MAEKKKQFTFYPSDNLYTELKRISDKTGIKMNTIVNFHLEQLMEKGKLEIQLKEID